MPIFCKTVITLLLRNFWLLIFIEKICSNINISIHNNRIMIPSIPITSESKNNPKKEIFKINPIINRNSNNNKVSNPYIQERYFFIASSLTKPDI